MEQKYTSKDTSLNQVSAVYKKIKFPSNSVILDFGGGKYDKNKEYVRKVYNSELKVYDPYNREEDENTSTLQYFIENPAQYVVCANVLNVLYGDNVVIAVLQDICNLMKKGGLLYISVYERDKTGVGCITTKGFQRNMKTKDYVPFIIRAFKGKCKVSLKNNILTVEKI